MLEEASLAENMETQCMREQICSGPFLKRHTWALRSHEKNISDQV